MSKTPQQEKVEAALGCIVRAFEDYNASFSDITQRAKRRFVACDRAGMTQDVAARYALYDTAIHHTINELEQILGERLFSRAIWTQIRKRYLTITEQLLDARLYRTFFNTISRRLFKTAGVDAAIEFTEKDALALAGCNQSIGDKPPTERFCVRLTDPAGVTGFIEAMGCDWPLQRVENATEALIERLASLAHSTSPTADIHVEMLVPAFYRGGRAYRVGRFLSETKAQPLVLAFQAQAGGVELEAILTETRQVSILFGYTFNYFMADLWVVDPVIHFLKSILPSKPVAELYTVLGRVKQGKTERYQSFFAHLSTKATDELVEAEGKKGMVMLVFTLPSYPLVFKLIRDRFAPSKQVTRSDVLERYHLVFRHDRVGRLIDAQEFRELKLPLASLSKPLLGALESECGRLVERQGEDLVIHHCYVERRVRPLDLYLAEVDEALATHAVIDYGQAIKDLARSNIFAGDLLPKNFGVTGSGRVIFYDYDELRLMSECHFRHWPQSGDDMLQMSAEPWFYVGQDDVFPEQFPLFMGLGPARLAVLRAHHGELFDADWWVDTQLALADGQLLDVPPFTTEAQLSQA
ncbi:MAG TPA: bifunctional isocitrate dehydrogenase kinase/phosphatase [Wenzhouxiangella sp.]